MPGNLPKQTILQWVAAYNAGNVEAAAALYHDDVTNVQMPWGKTARGRDAMRATFVKVFQAFPDIRIEIKNLVESGEWVVIEWAFGGTMRGEFAGHAPTGLTFAMQGCEVFHILDGKIQNQHGYWDKATMFDQLGIQTHE